MAPLPCLRAGHTEDNAAIAEGHGNQWQQKEAAEGEEVIGGRLPSSLEAAFGDTLSKGTGPARWTVWNRNSWSGVQDY